MATETHDTHTPESHSDAESWTLKLRRFDPESGEPAYWQEFEVELAPERSVLDGILKARNDVDG